MAISTSNTRTAYINDLLDAHRARVAAGQRNATAYGLPVRILTVAKTGLRIRFSDGRIDRAHPEDVHPEDVAR